jgi:hypothetical protein
MKHSQRASNRMNNLGALQVYLGNSPVEGGESFLGFNDNQIGVSGRVLTSFHFHCPTITFRISLQWSIYHFLLLELLNIVQGETNTPTTKEGIGR